MSIGIRRTRLNQDRSVAFSLTKRKIIHAEHTRGGSLFFWLGTNEPEERIGTDREAHACHQALAGFSAERKAHQGEDIGEPRRAPGIGFHDAGEALGEDLPRAFRVGAEEAAHMQFQVHGTAHPGEIRALLAHSVSESALNAHDRGDTLPLGWWSSPRQ
jgi:hypothetical protein